MKQHSLKFLRKRKLLMVLPLLVFPFVTLAFWAMGGGRSSENRINSKQSGLNLELPNANLKNDAIDKLRYYEKATRDSLKLQDEIQNDPYLEKSIGLEDTFSNDPMGNILPSMPKSASPDTDLNEEKVYDKLRQLNNVINSNSNSLESNNSNKYSTKSTNNDQGINEKDVHRLRKIVDSQSGTEEDPEMLQINGMLEKILDIQHPERVSDKLQENSLIHKTYAYAVTTDHDQNIYFPDTFNSKSNNDSNKLDKEKVKRFYSIKDKNMRRDLVQSSIQAVVHETQTLVDGSTVKLRLLNDIYIDGLLIPKGNFIFGRATLNDDRLIIFIKSILYKNDLLPVSLSVYDMDGLEGIYIPGSIRNDITKQTSDDALQNIGLNSLNPSIGTQAISAGISAGKNLLTKKEKLVKVTVKAGYKVLLENNNLE